MTQLTNSKKDIWLLNLKEQGEEMAPSHLVLPPFIRYAIFPTRQRSTNPENTNWRESFSTVDLLIKVLRCFVYIITSISYKLVNTRRSTVLRLPSGGKLTALAKKVNKAEELTYLSTNIDRLQCSLIFSIIWVFPTDCCTSFENGTFWTDAVLSRDLSKQNNFSSGHKLTVMAPDAECTLTRIERFRMKIGTWTVNKVAWIYIYLRLGQKF